MTFPPSTPPPDAPAPAPRQRPSTVTYAVFAQVALAVLGLISVVFNLATTDTLNQAIEEFAADQNVEINTNSTGGGVISILISLVIAAALITLAYFNYRGNRGTRIATWVVAGLFLCCNLFSGIFSLPVYGYTPGWYTAVSLLLTGLNVIALILVIVLLALPPSNEFFRKPPEQWQPPVGY